MTVFLRSSVIPAQAGIQKIATLPLLILLLVLTGCDAPGTARLKELCETEGYPRVYEKVSAAGYYDGRQQCSSAVRFFKTMDFEYIECRQSDHEIQGGFSIGLYRVSKELRNSGQCDVRMQKTMEMQPVRYQEMLDKNLCFSVEKISTPSAEYGIFNGKNIVTNIQNIFGSIIIENSMFIKHMDLNNVVSEDKTFSLYPTPGLKVSSFEKKLHCNTILTDNRNIPPLNKVDAYITPILRAQEERKDTNHGRNRKNLPGRTSS